MYQIFEYRLTSLQLSSCLFQEELVQLIERRVGVETFLNKLGLVMKHELYSRSLKHPQNSAREPRQLVFEHEFCRLFKALEGGLMGSAGGWEGGSKCAVLWVFQQGWQI